MFYFLTFQKKHAPIKKPASTIETGFLGHY